MRLKYHLTYFCIKCITKIIQLSKQKMIKHIERLQKWNERNELPKPRGKKPWERTEKRVTNSKDAQEGMVPNEHKYSIKQ